MRTRKTIGFGVFVMLWAFNVHAQQKPDTVIRLQEVVVQHSRLESYAVGHFVLKVDSAMHRLASIGTVADMMRKLGLGHIRSYGQGGLTTPSFRGTGASHTAILWNGINLQSPLNGQSDFTHIPVGFIDDVQFQSGGSASLFGSGAIGGTVHLNSRARFNRGWDLSLSTTGGSFQSLFQDGGVSWSGKKITSSTKFFRTASKNNFSFINRNKFPSVIEKREHAAIMQYGLLQQNYWQYKPGQVFSARFWYQNNEIDLPNPTTVFRKSEAVQLDEFYRAMLGWQLDKDQLHLTYQSSFIRHQLDYKDPAIQLLSKSVFDSFVNNVEAGFDFRAAFEGTVGVTYTWEQGKVDEFGADQPHRARAAGMGAIKYQPSTVWKGVLSVRQEWVEGEAVPLVPSLGIEVQASKKISFFSNVSRNYRIPTLNDLYWKDSGAVGNPGLRAESSWSEELGIGVHSVKLARFTFSGNASVFSNLVNNWILWSPTERGWSPDNIKKVWSRGAESVLVLQTIMGSVATELRLIYNFTRATNEEIHSGNLASELGKQLIFTPAHEGSAALHLAWKKTSIDFIHAYTGKQYTDGDNSNFFAMKSYQVASVWLSQEVSIKKIRSSFLFELNNLFSASYEARPGYPLPGRNFKIGLSIYFNKPNQL